MDFGGVPRTVTPVFYIDFPTFSPTAGRGGSERGKRAINKKKAERVVEVTPPKKQRRKKLVKKKKKERHHGQEVEEGTG